MANPANQGYRIPAEWEPHRATWLNWPNFTGVSFSEHQDHEHLENTYLHIVRALIPGEEVWINMNCARESDRIRSLFADDEISRLRFFEIPTKEPWLRDFGGTFVVAPGNPAPLALVDWRFNAWGGRYGPSEPENSVPRAIVAACDLPVFESDFVLEGGSIDANGQGLLLTTESCVLNPNRNPAPDRSGVEEMFAALLGIREVLWLPGGLAWDDLDGHIDAAARFADENLVVAATEPNPADPNHEPLAENWNRLAEWRSNDGRRLDLVELPLPAPMNYLKYRLPASYVNFYTGNEVVLVPFFGDPNDEIAAARLQEIHPERKVIPIDCRQIIRDFGALHCLLMNVSEPVTNS